MTGASREARGKLGGLKRRQIIRLLAAGELSQAEIARRYDVRPQSITDFIQRNRDEIDALRADMDNEFSGILIAQKEARLGVYQELLEQAMVPTPKITQSGRVVQRQNPETGEVETIMEIDVRAAAQVLKQAAEEMGQLPTRLQVQGGLDVTTRYVVEGVDPGTMK